MNPKCKDNASQLESPLPSVGDAEGETIPSGIPFIIDAHVHLFPASLFASVWQWFDQFGWPVRYRLRSREIIQFLTSRGIGHLVALHYAHKPGVARELNAYMADISKQHRKVTAMATVFPGEKETEAILKEGFAAGLSGVKLHSHVQCFDMDSPGMHRIYRVCTEWNRPLIMHVGREPKSPAYPCDPYELCRAEALEKVVKAYPDLRLCVPHLGADEFSAYRQMIEKYDNLWLDTTMTLAEYLPMDYFPRLEDMRIDRIMFGTDFPNIPYAWDRELKRLEKEALAKETLERILSRNAIDFYSIQV